MPLITWTDELSVGIDSIDSQHKKLIAMINALNQGLAEGRTDEVLAKIFEGLTLYTVKHFGYEEELFKKFGYANSPEHLAEHAALIKQVKELQEKVSAGNFMIGVEVMSFLKDWLTNHIMKTDKQYTEFLKSKGVQ